MSLLRQLPCALYLLIAFLNCAQAESINEAKTIRDDTIMVQDFRSTSDDTWTIAFSISKRSPYLTFIFSRPNAESLSALIQELEVYGKIIRGYKGYSRIYLAIVDDETLDPGVLISVTNEKPRAFKSKLFYEENLSTYAKLDARIAISKAVSESIFGAIKACLNKVKSDQSTVLELINLTKKIIELDKSTINLSEAITPLSSDKDEIDGYMRDIIESKKNINDKKYSLSLLRDFQNKRENFNREISKDEFLYDLERNALGEEQSAVLALCVFVLFPRHKNGTLLDFRTEEISLPRRLAVLAGFHSESLKRMEFKK